jgi:hypothetical protein
LPQFGNYFGSFALQNPTLVFTAKPPQSPVFCGKKPQKMRPNEVLKKSLITEPVPKLKRWNRLNI